MIKSAYDIIPLIKEYHLCKQEVLLLFTIDSNKRVIQSHIISQGNTKETKLNRLKIEDCLDKDNASFYILAHNHPNDDGNNFIVPSEQDMLYTWKLYKELSVPMLDHIIFNDFCFYSFNNTCTLKKYETSTEYSTYCNFYERYSDKPSIFYEST